MSPVPEHSLRHRTFTPILVKKERLCYEMD
jgi:hypothetical protein